MAVRRAIDSCQKRRRLRRKCPPRRSASRNAGSVSKGKPFDEAPRRGPRWSAAGVEAVVTVVMVVPPR